MLTIYNSLSRSKQVFEPIEPGRVRMYVCGMTVYDYCHLGHARVLVVFDVIARYLRASGFDLTYVRNVTDIDDKIIQRARDNNEPIDHLTDRFIEAMHEDSAALGVLPPDVEPRATRSMDEIRAMIATLLEKAYAYRADNGDVYYDVSRFTEYGRLSGKRLEDLRAGARIEVDESKRDPLDFVLWKAAKPGEPSWEAPWGSGRPGWHIECSAMSTQCLGHHFDIHGGGMDLAFPHHENEIAQSEGATGEPFVNYWIHNGFVQVDEEKMSKSLGNFFTVREILREFAPEEVRYFILASHYRSPLNYGSDNLEQARQAVTRLYTALRDIQPAGEVEPELRAQFHAAMDDDFNTPEALAVLFEAARQLNRAREEDAGRAAALARTLLELGSVLGLLQASPDQYLQGDSQTGLDESEIEGYIERRNQARSAKDFEEADRIREALKAQGIVLEDGAGRTTWRRV